MPILSIRHLTRYRYRNPVALGEHRMMFRPREAHDQQVLSHELLISPTPARLRAVHDVFGNCVGVAGFSGRARELVFDSRLRVEQRPCAPFSDLDGELDLYDARGPFAYDPQDALDLQTSIQPAFADPDQAVTRWARRFVRPASFTRLPTLLSDMTHAIRGEFAYRKRLESGIQTPGQTLELGNGSCRDFAVLMIEAARSLGLAARFVSGYICNRAGLGQTHSGEARLGEARLGAGHTHAWVAVYLPACGWVEFDPTNGIVGAAGLVRVAMTREPRQAAPLLGSWSGLKTDYLGMDVEVEVCAEAEAAPARRVAAR